MATVKADRPGQTELDAMRRKRTYTRRVFIRSVREIEESNDIEQMTVEFQYLVEKLEELKSFDSQIKNMTIDSSTDVQFDEECDECESYLRKYYAVKVKIEKLRKECDRANTSSAATDGSHQKRNIKLPNIELIKFDDNPKTWLSFWGQFKKIHEDETLEPEDKFQYLIQAMKEGSKSRELVTTYPPSGKNYPRALEQLQGRFAREGILIETYVRELLGLVLCQARGQHMDIRSLYDQLMTHLHALESLKVTTEKYGAMLYPLVESALPENILIVWNRTRIVSDVGQLTQLLEFLKREAESEEHIKLTRANFNTYSSSSSVDVPPTAACIVSKEETSSSKTGNDFCYFCDNTSHSILQCYKGLKMSLDEKRAAVKDKRGCLICLRKGHVAKHCKTFLKCMACGKRHVVIFCPDLHRDKQKEPKEATALFSRKGGNILLQTLILEVSNEGKKKKIRALYDTGSQRSYIRKNVVKELGLKVVGIENLGYSLFSGVTKPAENHSLVEVNVSSLDSSFSTKFIALELDDICGYLPKADDPKLRSKLKSLNISIDDSDCDLSDVNMLIGADYLGVICTGTIVQLDGPLVAIKMRLGWTLQGPNFYSAAQCSMTFNCHAQSKLSDLWDLEILGISEPHGQMYKDRKKEEVTSQFEQNISFKDNRYQVGFLWKDGYPEIGSNYNVAYKRRLTTTRKLERTGHLLSYNDVFQNWLDEDIIEHTENNIVEGHFIPHHAVIKMSRTTTKIRPVFDASCKDAQGFSLNNCIESGTNLIELIPKLLMNFRKGTYGVTSDIKQAFLQILVSEKDREYLKFLWWENPLTKEKIVTFRHKRLVFGVTCSPFLLAATINYHLGNFEGMYGQTVEILKHSFYVDNCVASFDTKEALFTFIDEAKEVMLRGGFDLRCWVTAPIRVDNTIQTQSVLGVLWNTLTDELQCSFRLSSTIPDRVTKRDLLSLTQQIFDPIGFLTPVTLVPKLIVEKAWIDSTGWDQAISNELSKEFKSWLSHVHLINDFKLPRRLSEERLTNCNKSLHLFCDASINAYAGCVFHRTECKSKVTIRLVMAKSRVAPIKRSITLPRLELMGALIASRLANEISGALFTDDTCPLYCWTDSAVVLAWIQRQCSWKPFVSNRVSEICAHTKKEHWRHVPGHCNPADLLSRGCNMKTLMDSHWWDGPAWLLSDQELWPQSNHIAVDENAVSIEAKKEVLVNTNVDTEHFSEKLLYFSKYSRIVRVVAWIFRWRRRRMFSTAYISNDEFEEAENILIRLIQGEHYVNRTKLNKKLCIHLDSNSVMRVKTRLGLGNYDKDFSSPI